MNNPLSHLEPRPLWTYFGEICQIPHPSKHEERIIEYMKAFGRKHDLDTLIDDVGNVIFKKPATPGMEDRRGVILQAHLDMVPQKNNDTVHDFLKDPIKPYIDGDWVKAEGTTLGADNGIGVAAAMAILASDNVAHGPIECLFTIDEETGMTGVFGLKPGLLSGKILMNLDSEDEGELYIGCAGGVDTSVAFDFTPVSVPKDYKAFKVDVKGLRGGHSGLDIHLGRGNANKILNRLLWQANREFGLMLSSIDGGSLRNAIPREATALVVLPAIHSVAFQELANQIARIVTKELGSADPGFAMHVDVAEIPDNAIDVETCGRIFNAIYACPNGVMRMITEMPDVVETSTNLAIVKSEKNRVSMAALQRSSSDTAKQDLCQMIQSVFELAGATVTTSGAYPGWKPDVNSPVLQTMKEVYNNKYGRIPSQKVMHAGLECGLIGGTYPGLDMISFGPTIRNPHSPDEKVNVLSVALFYEFLVETLKNIPRDA